MSEQFPDSEDSLRTHQLFDRSLAEWHKWLTEDGEGEPTGYLATPCSRFGRNGDECAWWAVACAAIYEDANGDAGVEPELLIDGYMGDAVNDSDGVLELVRTYYYAIPECLKPLLEHYDGDCNLAQQAALAALCMRYDVEFVAEHYTPQFDLPDGYVAGWVGGYAIQKEHSTIYVGCDEEGAISS